MPARQEALGQAIRVQETPVATVPATGGQRPIPTQRRQGPGVHQSVRRSCKTKYSGSDEGAGGRVLSRLHPFRRGQDGRRGEEFQERRWSTAIKTMPPLAKLSLAEDLFLPTARSDQGEEILRDLIENPTVLVS